MKKNRYYCNSPILIIIFNRPDFVKKLIDILREVQPKKIYVVADGPREDNEFDKDKCKNAREQINNIDWECDVKKKYSDNNLGCGFNPSLGISWAFEDSDELIILEDDCMPSIDFFKYCDELLLRYKNKDEIMMISGNNHTLGKFDFNYSYDYSHHTQTYGWATWSRAWKKYDFNISKWPQVRGLNWLEDKTGSKNAAKYWYKIFEMSYKKELISAWDYQWTFCCWFNEGINIIPKENLVSNVGFSESGTHEVDPGHPIANVPIRSLAFPLIHNPKFQNNLKLNKVIQRIIYTPPIYKRIIMKLLRMIK
jgi:hypothetical protein